MKKYLLLLLLGLSPGLHAEFREQTVSYKADGTTLKGYLVWDDRYGHQQPGVLVVHEWWGLNDYARQRARMLAQLGYTALAVDMYGAGKSSEHAADAAGFMKQVTERAGVAQQRFQAAMTLLKKQPGVDATKMAAIGYCFGGSTVLNMARIGSDLDAVVSFHGNLTTQTPAQPGKVKARILVLNGADDGFVTTDSIAAFKQEMAAASVDYRFINYPGAKHGFTNADAGRLGVLNNLPIAYNAEADRQSWAEMQQLFDEVFGKQ